MARQAVMSQNGAFGFAGSAMRGIIAPDRGCWYPVIQHD
jgi:hypothetical protein